MGRTVRANSFGSRPLPRLRRTRVAQPRANLQPEPRADAGANAPSTDRTTAADSAATAYSAAADPATAAADRVTATTDGATTTDGASAQSASAQPESLELHDCRAVSTFAAVAGAP